MVLDLELQDLKLFFIIIFSCISKCFSMHGGNDTSKSVIGIVWPSNAFDFCQLLISIRTITNVTLRYRQKYQINLYWPHSTTVRSDQIFTKGSKIFCSYSWWVLYKKSYESPIISLEAGTLMPGSEVVIADVSNNGQCGMGRLGEVWIRCDWSCSNYLCSYGGSPQLPLDDLQKSTKAKLMVGNDKGL